MCFVCSFCFYYYHYWFFVFFVYCFTILFCLFKCFLLFLVILFCSLLCLLFIISVMFLFVCFFILLLLNFVVVVLVVILIIICFLLLLVFAFCLLSLLDVSFFGFFISISYKGVSPGGESWQCNSPGAHQTCILVTMTFKPLFLGGGEEIQTKNSTVCTYQPNISQYTWKNINIHKHITTTYQAYIKYGICYYSWYIFLEQVA